MGWLQINKPRDQVAKRQPDHASALRLAQKVGESIEQRNSQQRISAQYGRVTYDDYDSEARNGMRQYNAAVESLRKIHIRNSQSFSLTQREVDRRQGMLEELQTKEKQLEQMLHNDNPLGLGGTSSGYGGGGSNPWADEDDMGNNMSVHDIRQHQQNMVKEQDEGIGILAEVIARQKSMAADIGNEIDRQDGLIDDIQTNVDRTDSRVREETERARNIIVKENRGNCAMWIVMVLLFIAIIVIVCLPKIK